MNRFARLPIALALAGLMAPSARAGEPWVVYPGGPGPGQGKNVVLISGWVKAPADWAAAAFSNTHRKYELSLKGQVGRLLGMQLSGSRARTHSGPEMQRHGAKYPKTAGRSATKDQCVFIKRYMVRKRLGIVRELVAGAGYDELYVANMGPHYEEMIAFYGEQVLPQVR